MSITKETMKATFKGAMKHGDTKMSYEDWLEDLMIHQIDENIKLDEIVKDAVNCIKKIADPVANLQELAKIQNMSVDGNHAVSLSKDPEYLKGIAKGWLNINKELS